MKQYIVDAFTAVPGAGNPAAVCVMETWPDDAAMQALAKKNGLSETAFLVKEGEGYRLRWFTPENEEVLCGHATLASSFVILNYVEPGADTVLFYSRSGKLRVVRKDGRYEMDFPTFELTEIPVTEEMARAFGALPDRRLLGGSPGKAAHRGVSGLSARRNALLRALRRRQDPYQRRSRAGKDRRTAGGNFSVNDVCCRSGGAELFLRCAAFVAVEFLGKILPFGPGRNAAFREALCLVIFPVADLTYIDHGCTSLTFRSIGS